MRQDKMVAEHLQRAIARGEKRLRKVWAADLGVSYAVVCLAVAKYNLYSAIVRVRAESAEGTLRIQAGFRSSGYRKSGMRIPACALNAAGFDTASELSYIAAKGRIIITRSGGRA